MKYVLALALALVLGATPLHARDDVTPEQVAALKKRISSIDNWLKDAEKDRSSLERQLATTEQRISELTRERRPDLWNAHLQTLQK